MVGQATRSPTLPTTRSRYTAIVRLSPVAFFIGAVCQGISSSAVHSPGPSTTACAQLPSQSLLNRSPLVMVESWMPSLAVRVKS